MKEQKYFRQTCHSFDWFLEHVVGQDRKWIPLNTDQEVQKSGKLKSGNQCVGLNIGLGLFQVTKSIHSSILRYTLVQTEPKYKMISLAWAKAGRDVGDPILRLEKCCEMPEKSEN